MFSQPRSRYKYEYESLAQLGVETNTNMSLAKLRVDKNTNMSLANLGVDTNNNMSLANLGVETNANMSLKIENSLQNLRLKYDCSEKY